MGLFVQDVSGEPPRHAAEGSLEQPAPLVSAVSTSPTARAFRERAQLAATPKERVAVVPLVAAEARVGPRAATEKPRFLWPVRAPLITSPFGPRGGGVHFGVDLVSARGDHTILAGRSGVVVFSGTNGGYGNLVILRHEGEYETYYAHLAQRYVRIGQLVRAGDPIGRMGQTGNATGVHLHFEVRYQKTPQNPLAFLP
ncbi:MAG: metalloendopeptidase [Brockia lithotrophica]|uniref:Metalloendopeptidase n=1 Tax=Brockia lithotrophica TaxID=933949 RepID=A0A2T5GAZ4_9BACL|nr:MAG: metalloendopeptidase [Brockia lithotrophica]